MHRAAATALLAATLGLAGCNGLPDGGSDFARFGGHAGIAALVEDTLVRSATDPRIARHFTDANLVRLHRHLSEQVCIEVGGPCTYTGFPMREVHAGRGITDTDFNVLVEHLVDAMEARGIPRAAQYRLLEGLAAMHGDVTYR